MQSHGVDFMLGCPCGFSAVDLQPYIDAGYFSQPVSLIDLRSDYRDLIGGHKNNTRREIAKATRSGYYVKAFHPRSYLADLIAINTSKAVRSGGRMRENYTRTADSAADQPAVRGQPPPPKCRYHQTITLGVFSASGGHWGDGQVVAYLYLQLAGEFVNYSSILGHGDHLKFGVMPLLHSEALSRLERNGFSRYVVYYLFDNPKGLMDWKRRAGFRENRISAPVE